MKHTVTRAQKMVEIAKDKEVREYEKHIQPDLIRFLAGKDTKITTKHVGQGAYGSVSLLTCPNVWPFGVVLKRQRCDTAFDTEVKYLNAMQRLTALGVPGMGRIFDAYSSSRYCFIVMPYAKGDIRSLAKNMVREHIVSIAMQMVVGVYFFHTFFSAHHCDAHIGNWLYYDKPVKGSTMDGYTIPDCPVSVNLVDPGLARNTFAKTNTCRSALYDYYRIFSPFSGLADMLPEDGPHMQVLNMMYTKFRIRDTTGNRTGKRMEPIRNLKDFQTASSKRDYRDIAFPLSANGKKITTEDVFHLIMKTLEETKKRRY